MFDRKCFPFSCFGANNHGLHTSDSNGLLPLWRTRRCFLYELAHWFHHFQLSVQIKHGFSKLFHFWAIKKATAFLTHCADTQMPPLWHNACPMTVFTRHRYLENYNFTDFLSWFLTRKIFYCHRCIYKRKITVIWLDQNLSVIDFSSRIIFQFWPKARI